MFPNLKERAASPGTRLSGGEQQMLAVARILRTGARLLLLDEISEGLAPVIVQKLAEMILTLKAKGYTIVLVEQNFRFAAPLADRFYVMEHGTHREAVCPEPSWPRTWACCRSTWASDAWPDHPRSFPRFATNLTPGDTMKLKTLVAALAIGFAAAASAQDTGPVKIGFITDMSSLYADIDGPAGGEMIKWAAQDFGGKVLNRPIEVLTADHQNKADVASSKAREWIDKDNLSMLIGGTNSGTALAMAKVAEEKKRPFIAIGAGSARLTNEACSPYTVHYAYDTVALAKVAGTRAGQGRRQELVLPDGRLRLRPLAGSRRLHRGQGQRRHRGRRGAPSAQCLRLLVLPAAGAVVQGPDPGAGQCRRRLHQRHEGGQGIRHQQDHEGRRPAGVHQRRAQPGPGQHRRPAAGRQLVLEPGRRVAQVRQALLRQVQAHAFQPAGRRLFGRNATT